MVDMSAFDQAASDTEIKRISGTVWVSFVSACLAWLFDAFDLTILILVLFPSVSELLGSADPAAVASTGGVILACKLLAWGAGGIAFGVVADRIGRAKCMMITVLIYSVFTGMSGLAQNWWQLLIFQALAGVGIGGEWAAGAALVAETWPERTRQRALVVMQMSFAGGFFLAGLLNVLIGPAGWRWMFAAGMVPAVLAVLVRAFVPEPERWVMARNRRRIAHRETAQQRTMGSFAAIFAPDVRRHTVVGALVVAAMMIGTWGTTTLLPTWIVELVGMDGARAVKVTGTCFMLANVGAVFGYLTLLLLNDAIGRRWSYVVVVIGCIATGLYAFTQINEVQVLLWFMPLYGFFAIGGFAVFAAYLPELFPTRIRAAGQGFCWNMARALTAVGPLTSGMLVDVLESVPKAAVMLSASYLIGLVAIWFGPETRGVPLRD
jgi:MFS family permease